jgi:hypothetical protein
LPRPRGGRRQARIAGKGRGRPDLLVALKKLGAALLIHRAFHGATIAMLESFVEKKVVKVKTYAKIGYAPKEQLTPPRY